MTTLSDLIQLPRFSDLTIVSANKNLDRPVTSVEITETPDIASYIPNNAIILTTAMIYKDDQSKLKPFIASLVPKKVAALCIKVGRFIEDIDPEVIDYATQLDIPLIKVPSTRPLGNLLYQMLSYVWDTKAEQLSYALDIQKKFSSLLMNDVNNGRFISELGKIINAPVILLSPWHKVVSHSHYFSDSSHPASFYIEQISDLNYEKINEGKSSFIVNDLKGEKIQVLGYPVKVNNYFPFNLIILKPEQIPYPISEFAIEQAALVLSFMMYKNFKVKEFFEILKSDYLDQLTNAKTNQSSTSKNWLHLGANYGLIHSNYYQFAIAYCIPNKNTRTQMIYRDEESQIAENWLQEQLPLRIRDVAIFKIKKSNEIALIFQKKTLDAERILQNLSIELKKLVGIDLRFSFGNARESLSGIPNSFIEAKSAIDESRQLLHPTIVNYYHPKGLIGLFENTNEESLRYFCEKTLKGLAYPSEQSAKELRKTLKYYLDYNCEITKTAESLFLHRNTIKYRIKQCEKLLGLSIKNPQNSLNLRLALELSQTENSLIR